MQRNTIAQAVVAHRHERELRVKLSGLYLQHVEEVSGAGVVAQAAEAQRFRVLRQDRFEIALLIRQPLLAGKRTLHLAEGAKSGLAEQRRRGLLLGGGESHLRLQRAAEEQRREHFDARPPEPGTHAEQAEGYRIENHKPTTKPPDPAKLDKWRREMSPEDLKAYDDVAGPLLRELGYEVTI